MRVLDVAILLAVTSALPLTAQTISAAEASEHVGQHATVCGEISGEHTASNSRGTPTFINLDKPYPNQVFAILVWGENRASVGDVPESGKVCVTGTITEYRGGPHANPGDRLPVAPGWYYGTPEIVLRDSHSWYQPKQ